MVWHHALETARKQLPFCHFFLFNSNISVLLVKLIGNSRLAGTQSAIQVLRPLFAPQGKFNGSSKKLLAFKVQAAQTLQFCAADQVKSVTKAE